MACGTIEVHFKQTGERIDVPVCSGSTVTDIIRYVCTQSTLSTKIACNDYYLVLLNNSEMLDDDKTVEETKILTIENPKFQLCMKTAIREQIMALSRWNLMIGPTGGAFKPQIPVITKHNKKVSVMKVLRLILLIVLVKHALSVYSVENINFFVFEVVSL
jgi:hypothetical protein